MKRISLLISKYLISTIVPYFAFAWLLLSVILFVQQASRYSDIFFSVHVPSDLAWQLTIALVPNVIAFTCPMAILVGTIIGLTKMQGDSELVAIRAAGVGSLQIAAPILVLGLLLSVFAFVVNLRGVPLAAALVRNVALQTAIKKLESPIEPGVFNTEVAGHTIYVRDGNVETGRWRDIFIYTEDPAAATIRLVTSREGRIDTTGQMSELVLEDAVATTLPKGQGEGKYVSENIGEARFAIRTGRAELIERLGRTTALTPEEMGLQQLSDLAASAEGRTQTEARLLAQRRLLLSVTPFIFCVLGAAVVLRLNRGGRGFAIILALGVLIGFYLLALLGEQLARTGAVSVPVAGLLPVVGSLIAVLWFSFSRRLDFLSKLVDRAIARIGAYRRTAPRTSLYDRMLDVTTGLRDFDLALSLAKNFLLALGFLAAIFLIFTAFEHWKFAGAIDGGVVLLAKYLFYLLPFVYLQIAPSAAMLAILATYVIKSRQNEIVTWTSSGQSVYRLLVPAFLLALLLGALDFLIQERILPTANRMQDTTRSVIRNMGLPADRSGRFWVATDRRIYSFEQVDPPAGIVVYEFAEDRARLRAVYRAASASWNGDAVRLEGPVERDDVTPEGVHPTVVNGAFIAEQANPFTEPRSKPSHLDSFGLRRQIGQTESEIERRALRVALQQRYSTWFVPLAIALFTAPFSLSLSRRRKAWAVGYAVGLWLLFMGTTSIFLQLGLNGYLTPALAVWSPPAIFALLGIYLLTRVRT